MTFKQAYSELSAMGTSAMGFVRDVSIASHHWTVGETTLTLARNPLRALPYVLILANGPDDEGFDLASYATEAEAIGVASKIVKVLSL